MGVLEAVVIVTIIMTAVYVGYQEWQASIEAPDDHAVPSTAEPHRVITSSYSIIGIQGIFFNIMR